MWKSAFIIFVALVAAGPCLVQAEGTRTTDMKDQHGLELTVYNVDLALVKDKRSVSLSAGRQELRFTDVASRIVPQSVHIRSLEDGDGLDVLEQNYEYDLLSPRKLMEKYVGREVKVLYRNPYTDREETTRAVILSTNDGTVLRIGDEITFGYEGRIIFPSVPEDLIARPTLVWLLENRRETGMHALEAAYLTEGVTWQADYVLALADDGTTAGLSGWVTITNRSGAAYRDADLKLVAGDVHRAREEAVRFARMAEAAVAARPRFEEEPLFEYHLYALDRRTTLKDNQSKQIGLLRAPHVTLRKDFVLEGSPRHIQARHAPGTTDQKVSVYVEFLNDADNGLGMPLPRGTVRMYQADRAGSLQFIGEDSVDHTQKDETVRLRTGSAFDLAASRTQTSWERIGKQVQEAAFKITLRNHKNQDVTVRVVEPIPGDWRMLESSHPHERTDAYTAEFKIPVPADGEAVLTYRVRIRL